LLECLSSHEGMFERLVYFFSDPDKKMKLEMLSTYWHFLDALWIFLVLFFFGEYGFVEDIMEKKI
jgi:heme/copper-type cytochrome/quinol oxidase subunit 3